MGFTKLFSTILASSIWQEDDETRLVWVTMMAMAGKSGIVEASAPGLAHLARVSLEACEKALKKFEGKDEYSRSLEYDGRRIEKVEGGWKLLNYEKYRNTLDVESRREYKRVKQAQYRSRKAKKEDKPLRTLPGERAYERALKREDGSAQKMIDMGPELKEQGVEYRVEGEG